MYLDLISSPTLNHLTPNDFKMKYFVRSFHPNLICITELKKIILSIIQNTLEHELVDDIDYKMTWLDYHMVHRYTLSRQFFDTNVERKIWEWETYLCNQDNKVVPTSIYLLHLFQDVLSISLTYLAVCMDNTETTHSWKSVCQATYDVLN